MKFNNPVGLAAGFDKDALLVDEWGSFGFSFVEVGTLTPKPQPGNDKPRLFRLKKDNALINRMGFNNRGVKEAAERLYKRKSKIIVGGNIGKNKTTPNDDAYRDYEQCFDELYPCVDYFVVNISSPNTPGLRDLQEKEPLLKILSGLMKKRNEKSAGKPILLKISPDLTHSQLDDIIEIAKNVKLDGIIATNTTVSREGLRTNSDKVNDIGAGGLSGAPLKDRSNEVIRYLRREMGNDFPIIGAGGIMSPHDALEKLKAGADLIQIYTGFIYNGPSFIKKINKAILKEFNYI